MKTYLCPQPYAVERVNKIQNTASDLAPPRPEKLPKSLDQISDKELYETEAEEQAWKDVLEKDH